MRARGACQCLRALLQQLLPPTHLGPHQLLLGLL